MLIGVEKLEMYLFAIITWSHDGDWLNLIRTLLKLVAIVLPKVEIKLFLISRDHMINKSRDSVGEIPSPYIDTVRVRTTELNIKNIYVLQIGASLC